MGNSARREARLKNINDPVEGPREILAGLATEEQDIRRKTEVLQKELEPKIQASEKARAEAQARVKKLESELEERRAGYLKTLATVEAEERQAIEAQVVQLEDVQAGKVSMEDYYKRGRTSAQIQAKAKTAAEAKVFELLKIVRAKALDLILAERDLYRSESEIAYAITAPGLMWVQGLKEFTARAEAKVNAILAGGWPVAKMRLDKKEEALAQSADKGFSDGLTFNSVDVAGLRELKLDPRIPEAWLPQLDEAIASLGEGQACDVKVRYRRPGHGVQIISYETIKGMTTELVK